MSTTSEPIRPLPPSSPILISVPPFSLEVSRLSDELARLWPFRGPDGRRGGTAPPSSRQRQHQREAGEEHSDLEEQRAPGGSSEVDAGGPAADRGELMPDRSRELAGGRRLAGRRGGTWVS